MEPRPRSLEMDLKGSYAWLARAAFTELGPEGKEAVPTLIGWLGRRAATTNEFDPVAGAAYVILGKMAPASIGPLTEALSSQDDQVYALAAGALGEIGPEASAAIPVLRRTLKDKSPMVRAGAADVMGRLGGQADQFMPVIIQTLSEPDVENLDYKLGLLLRYKEEAKGAMPVLLELLRRTRDLGNPANKMARYALERAVKAIAIETLRESRRRNGRAGI